MARVAVLYATCGGMGDVGKFVALHALNHPNVTPTIVAVSFASTEGTGLGEPVDITDAVLRETVTAKLAAADVIRVDIGADGAEAALAAACANTDAVVACLGNRQEENMGRLFGIPGYPTRWCELGARKTMAAMATAGVSRLVQLSSFGIGDDYTPLSGLKVFWRLLLNTAGRSMRRDLINMEAAVTASDSIDYALVRALGLTPDRDPTGQVKVLRSSDDGNVDMSVAKSDIAQFMLDEALAPTVHRAAVTVGHPPPETQ